MVGADHFNRRANTSQPNRLVNRLKSLEYDAQISPLAA
jgi:hypothetical protein